MKQTCILSPARQLTEEEQSLVWQKPPSHIESEAENISENGEYSVETEKADKNAIRLRKSADSEGHSDTSSDENTDVSKQR